ncbi:hypothetical protein AMECASPLE_014085 [Ameca splendens]|uniref:Uncharacterized protein n=1 Tax=Ameca splendens TaxID=208324 RepID=A0ABV1A7U3_9TELE
MVFVVAFNQNVSSLSLSLFLSLSPSSSSRLSARPPEDADVVLMTAMERVHGTSSSSSEGKFASVRVSAFDHLEFKMKKREFTNILENYYVFLELDQTTQSDALTDNLGGYLSSN